MNIQQTLKDKYPEFFNNDRFCGIHIAEGWVPLVEKLLDDIWTYCLFHDAGFPRIYQIKEKFGQARIYWGANTMDHHENSAYVGRLIEVCIIELDQTCEYTGKSGASVHVSPTGCYTNVASEFAEEYGFTKSDVDNMNKTEFKKLKAKYMKFRQKYDNY